MRLFFITILGIALGWWEGVVVVYIREILSNYLSDITKLTIEQLKKPLNVAGNFGYSLLFIEKTREIAPIILIVLFSCLLEKRAIRKFALFLWLFAIWDIFYYITLKILINWPSSFFTVDCLFLIPFPWIAPIWVPLLVMFVFLLVSGYIFSHFK